MKVAVTAFLFAKRNMEIKHLFDDLQFLIYDLLFLADFMDATIIAKISLVHLIISELILYDLLIFQAIFQEKKYIHHILLLLF